jgi:TetR/AcrR family transcriptional regulator, acrAB operon repressor
MVRRTKEEALATRHRILDTAEELFHRHGVSRTSLHDIAQAAGVTRGAIYWHFTDKADVFNAMMERVCLPMEETFAHEAHAAAADPIAHVRANLLDVFRRTVHDARVHRVFEIATHKVEYVDELLAVRDRHLQARNDHLARVERALRSAKRRGLLSTTTPVRSLALGLHALIDGLIQSWMLDPRAFDLLRVGREAVDTYLAGLGARPGDTAQGSELRRPARGLRLPAA